MTTIRRYPIYLNYGREKPPIGFVEFLEDDIPENALIDGAIVPYLVKKPEDEDFKVTSFGFIPRIKVDTRQRT